MAQSQWRPVGLVDFTRLREARFNAHYALQWLARAARAYIAPKPDDGHTNLGWDEGFNGFTTHLFSGMRLGLRLPDLTLALLDKGRLAHSLPLHGQTEAQIRGWLGTQMQELNLAPAKLDEPLPYSLPPHPLAEGARYDATVAEPLRELAAWYANGHHALSALKERLAGRGLPAPDVRLWPHHFDLDCLTVIGQGAAYAVPTMGAGFSSGDHYYEEPYFYISLYPRPDLAALPALEAPGHWHKDDFLAAVAPASGILALRDRQAETEAFLHSAADGIVELLSGARTAGRN